MSYRYEIEGKDRYAFAHGHAPRGKGYWAFQFCLPEGHESRPEPYRHTLEKTVVEFAPGDLLFTAACKWARKRAAELQALWIQVCS